MFFPITRDYRFKFPWRHTVNEMNGEPESGNREKCGLRFTDEHLPCMQEEAAAQLRLRPCKDFLLLKKIEKFTLLCDIFQLLNVRQNKKINCFNTEEET